MRSSPGIFKAYDIRGVVPSTLDAELAEALGRAYGAFTRQQGHVIRGAAPGIPGSATAADLDFAQGSWPPD